MIKVNVWIKENGSYYKKEIRHLKPRRYMLGWDFEKVLAYIKEELYWNNINEEDVLSVEFENEKEHWINEIKK